MYVFLQNKTTYFQINNGLGRTKSKTGRKQSLQKELDIPGDIKILDAFVVTDRFAAERYVHERLSNYRVLNEREIFAIDRFHAVKLVEQIVHEYANQEKVLLKNKIKSKKRNKT